MKPCYICAYAISKISEGVVLLLLFQVRCSGVLCDVNLITVDHLLTHMLIFLGGKGVVTCTPAVLNSEQP